MLDRRTFCRLVARALALGGLAVASRAGADEALAPSLPPPPRVESPPPSPSADTVWISGYWLWRDGKWEWTGGRWEKAQGRYYVPGRYKQTPRGWIWEPGRWQR